MASTAAIHIASHLQKLAKPLATFWKRLGDPPHRGWAYMLVTRADREGIPISPDNCLLFCDNGLNEVPLLVSECGYTHLSVVDTATLRAFEMGNDVSSLARSYAESMQLPLAAMSWESPQLRLQFGEVVINHYLCQPDDLVLVEAPSHVLIWDTDSGRVNHTQGWVANLASGTVILSSDLYPLLRPDESHKLGNHMHGGSAACYSAQELYYTSSGLVIHETHSLLGYLTKS